MYALGSPFQSILHYIYGPSKNQFLILFIILLVGNHIDGAFPPQLSMFNLISHWEIRRNSLVFTAEMKIIATISSASFVLLRIKKAEYYASIQE